MRSSLFVLLSVSVHALAVAAIAISPYRVAQPEGHPIEVQVGEPAEQPGLAEAPVGETKASEPLTTPNPPPAPVEVAKAAARKTRVVKTPMEKPIAKVTEETVQDEKQDEKLDPQVESATGGTDHIEVAPDAGQGESEEAPVARGNEHGEESELAQGGATQAGAVSYLDLRQSTGNKSPAYPMQARREGRQGQVELVYRVTKEGNVSDLQIATSSGHKDLDQEAVRAVALFKFVPGQEGWARHPVAFTLKGDSSQAPSRLRNAHAE